MKKKFCRPAGILSAFLLPAVYFSVHAQTRTVTGIVNDGTKPISGVTVSQEGSGQATASTSTGTFSLVITGENPVLVFRHPEYTEKKISADGKTFYTVSLTEKVNTIQEVVLNAGYYNVKAKESTGSIAKVAAKDIENQPVNNVLSAVQGRMSGVSITNNNGNAGGGFDIAIRGKNSLRFDGNAPLFIVNGVPLNTTSNSVLSLSTGALSMGQSSPLNALNPNDIESFEVLKDADATAIYGSRGANGVVLITTKRGTSKDLTATLTLNTSFSQANKLIELASTEQYRKLRQDAFRLDGISAYPYDAYDLNGTWDTARQTDWYKTFIGRTFISQQQELALSGGTPQQQIRLSLFNGERGTAYGNGFLYRRYGFTLNNDYRSPNGKIIVRPSVQYTEEKNNLAAYDITAQIFLAPNAPALFHHDGSLNWENNTFENPLAQFENKYTATTKSFSSRLLAEYLLLPSLSIRVNTGYTQTLLDEFKTSPSTQYNPVYGATAQYSSIISGNTGHNSWILEPQLNYEKKWNTHKINAVLGATFEDRKSEMLSLMGSDFSSNDLLYNISNAKFQKVQVNTVVQYRYEALYGRANYTFQDRYIVNLTARRDGSSRFGPENRFANFGAVGLAWIFSKEHLFEGSVLSFGKIRGSFGVAGNDQIGDYQYLNTYTTGNASYGGAVGLYPSRLFNPDFTWEKTAKTEAALELGFLKETLNFTAAWYRNRSSNQLVGAPLPATTGFTTVQQNFPATVQNSGLELDLSAVLLRKKELKWNISANISFPDSKLIEFRDIENSTYANTYEVGRPMTIRKVYEYTGIDKENGIYQFRDVNGDGKITLEDRVKTADFGIRFFGGISNTFSYRNLSLLMMWQFVRQQQFDTLYDLAVPGSMFNIPSYMLDYWTPENTNAAYQRPTSGADADALRAFDLYRNSDAAIVDASFLRLNSLQLNAKIPLGVWDASQLILGIQGQNLWTITPFKGLDPEVRGLYLPSLKTYSISATLKF